MTSAAWTATLIALGVAVVLAVVSAATRRDWLGLPAVAPLGMVLALRVLGVTQPGGAGFETALGILLVALATTGGGPLVAFVLRVILRSPEKLGKNGIDLDGADADRGKRAKRGRTDDKEVLRGGATIGYLERLASAGAVLVGQPAAIAIVVAIKGLGRFTELDSSAARERFIVGTLLSLTWAGACTAGIIATW